MDTKKTQALLLALEKGSLTAAAEVLGYTQSGLTHMMNSLEDETGLKLLVRSKGGVRLSPALRVLPLDPPASRQMGIIVSQHRKKDKSVKLLIKCARQLICHEDSAVSL